MDGNSNPVVERGDRSMSGLTRTGPDGALEGEAPRVSPFR